MLLLRTRRFDMFMLNKKSCPCEDEYGGTEIAYGTESISHYNGDVLSEGFRQSLTPDEPIDLPADEYDKLVGEIKNSISSSFTCAVIVAVFVIAVAFVSLFIPFFSTGTVSGSGGGIHYRFLPLQIFAGIAVVLAVVFGRLMKRSAQSSKLKNADYQAAAFEVQAKYSNTDSDNDHHYYVVLNGVWIQIFVNVYKNIRVGDKIACMFAYAGDDTLFAVSDYVISFRKPLEERK